MSEIHKTVAIIGAGLAGLACAVQLTKAGYTVAVFEKSRGVGGRMSTRRVSDTLEQGVSLHWQCDHGAQYFTARDPLFIRQIDEWIAQGVVGIWSPSLHSFGIKPGRQTQHTGDITRYVGVPGMTAPARQLAKHLNIHCQQRVTSIRQQNGQWMLAIENQDSLHGPFERVVFALPAQQVDALLAASLDVPADFLMHAASFTQQHALSPCWAMMLHVAEPLSLPFDAAFVNPDSSSHPVLSWMARDSSKPGRPAGAGESWLLHASTDWSLQHIDSLNTEVSAAMLLAFTRLTGIHPDRHRPVSSSLHRWRYAQALHSLNSPGYVLGSSCGLGICGDWLNKGRVEGAWLSGYHLAHALIADAC